MNPSELNLLITAVVNNLYCSLSKEEFRCLSIIFSEMSKSMFSMTLLQEVCQHKGSCGKNEDKKCEAKKPPPSGGKSAADCNKKV